MLLLSSADFLQNKLLKKYIMPMRFASSDLVLHCLPMSHEKDARLIWVKYQTIFFFFHK